MSRDWDESEHPRHPGGSSRGGQFRHTAEHTLAAVRQLILDQRSQGNEDMSLLTRFGALNVAAGEGYDTVPGLERDLREYVLRGPTGFSGYLTEQELRDFKAETEPAFSTGAGPWARRRSFRSGVKPKDWADKLDARRPSPFPNNDQGRRALHERVLGSEPVFISDLAGGQTAITNRWEFQDGTAIVRKAFYNSSSEDFDEETGEDPGEGQSLWYDEEQEAEAVAEWKASLVAEAIGAPALTVIPDPDGEPNVVYYGYANGEPPPGFTIPAGVLQTDEALLIGVLDLLIINEDRAGGNWLITPDGKPFAIDHGESFQAMPAREERYVDGSWQQVDTDFDLLPSSGPFGALLFESKFVVRDNKTGKIVTTVPGSMPVGPPAGSFSYERRQTWKPNRLSQADIALMKQRILHLYNTDQLTSGENRYMQAMLSELAKHATGDRRLVQ